MTTYPNDKSSPIRPTPNDSAPQDRFDPIPVPDVTEDNSDTTWELWQEASRAANSWDADTVPMDLLDE